jgi:hypothetical protein
MTRSRFRIEVGEDLLDSRELEAEALQIASE